MMFTHYINPKTGGYATSVSKTPTPPGPDWVKATVEYIDGPDGSSYQIMKFNDGKTEKVMYGSGFTQKNGNTRIDDFHIVDASTDYRKIFSDYKGWTSGSPTPTPQPEPTPQPAPQPEPAPQPTPQPEPTPQPAPRKTPQQKLDEAAAARQVKVQQLLESFKNRTPVQDTGMSMVDRIGGDGGLLAQAMQSRNNAADNIRNNIANFKYATPTVNSNPVGHDQALEKRAQSITNVSDNIKNFKYATPTVNSTPAGYDENLLARQNKFTGMLNSIGNFDSSKYTMFDPYAKRGTE